MNLFLTASSLLPKKLVSLRKWLRPAVLILGMLSAPSYADNAPRVSHALFEDVESKVFDNGLQVIMAPRTSSDSILVQLVIGVGLRDFACDKQQIPHVIEHLLFESNTKFSPEVLRNKVRDKGGNSNGWTNDDNTLFTISIHSDYEQEALNTLLSMVQDLRWDEADFPRVKRIVDSELETPTSPIQRWFDSKRSVVDIAKGRLYPGTNLECIQRSEAEPLTLDEIKAAYDTYYHASNMTLILVGKLSDSTLQWANEKFGSLPVSHTTANPSSHCSPGEIPGRNEPLIEKGSYGSAQAWVNLLARMPGSADNDFAAAKIITEYFNERLFAEVRLKYGLGYTPNAFLNIGNDSSELVATTKTRSDVYHLTQQVFESTYQKLRNEKISSADLHRIKQKLILKFEAKERDSLDIAEFYRMHRQALRNTGIMPNEIEAYRNVTVDDVARVINRYLPEQPLIAILRPPSPIEAAMAVSGIILGAAILGWPLNRWVHRRRSRRLPSK